MYTQPEGRPRGSARARIGAVTFYTLLCFSLAGLLVGFAIGGFAGHLSHSSITGGSSTATTSSVPTVKGRSPIPTATTGPENVYVAVPGITAGDYSSSQMADGTTSYHLAVQVVNKADQTPITATDVTCRLWLTSDLQATTAGLSTNNYALPKNPGLFSQPFPSEVEGALNFASNSQQTQPCAANGKTNWTYTLATSVPSGAHYLGVLADWKGIHYNWYLVAITIHAAGNTGD
jgi:hypothetical protein